jgi:hypothetical protein
VLREADRWPRTCNEALLISVRFDTTPIVQSLPKLESEVLRMQAGILS